MPLYLLDKNITLDQPLINNFRFRQEQLSQRLFAMTRQLPEPYRPAALPHVFHPMELIR
jgi:hypothetical protein